MVINFKQDKQIEIFFHKILYKMLGRRRRATKFESNKRNFMKFLNGNNIIFTISKLSESIF